ncbi:nucleolin 1 [Orussus abietinus]|uniref:nucleolin 1 n=1 Tax=Orussus abietinus TaxID=222816 RepID=UPI000625D2EB|nr:nucleolin 1 [Orussus abietinus]
MADISKDELRKEIAAILKDADLTTMSAKKVRQQIEAKLDINLSERKKEVDDLVMESLQEKQDGGKKKKKAASEESEDGEEEEEEGSEEEEEEEEKKPAKRSPAKKTATKRKGSSDDEESASDDDASDEEYSPKKAKPAPKKGKPNKKGKKKGSDSDSDEEWGKIKKSGGSGKKGAGKGKGGGYTRAILLSPELASVVGAERMARHEVVKKVWSIIKERNLYDPKNKQFAICDDELMKVIGVKRFRTFGMMKYLKNHFVN